LEKGKTMQTVVGIAGTISPSLQKAIDDAAARLEDLSKETLESAGAAAKLAVEIDKQEDVIKSLQKEYANYIVSGKGGSKQAEELAHDIGALSFALEQDKETLAAAEKAAKALTETSDGLGEEVDNAGEKAEKSGKKFDKMSGILKAVGAAAAAAVLAAGAAAFSLGKDVVNSFGELEQNLGGSEAVFGEYAEDIQKIGEEAYKNLGVSQSDYLATANKMGALFQGSGVEQQKSLELTERAMQRAADMASVMGIDMQVALDSVAGAAKGNFTMMDNLGVAMNETTLKAYAAEKGLIQLSDAEKAFAAWDSESLSLDLFAEGADADLAQIKKEYQNIIEAFKKGGEEGAKAEELLSSVGISALDLQQKGADKLFDKFVDGAERAAKKMGETPLELSPGEKSELAMQMFFEKTEQYAGNFARESTQTISGSFGLLEASYKSFIAGLGNSEADIANLAGNVIDAFTAVVGNVTPIIQNIVNALPPIVAMIPGIIKDILPDLLNVSLELFKELLGTIFSLLPDLIPVAVDAVMTVVGALIDNLPSLIGAAVTLVTALVAGIGNALPELIPAAVDAVVTIVDGLVDNLPMLLDAALQLILGLAEGVIKALPRLISSLPKIINGIVGFIIESIPQIIEAGIELLTSLIKAMPDILKTILVAIPQIVLGIVTALLDNIDLIIKSGIDLFVALIAALPEIIAEIVMAIPQIIDAIVGTVGVDAVKVTEAFGRVWEGIKNVFGGVADWFGNVFGSAWEGVRNVFGKGGEIFKGITDGILETFIKVVNGIIGGINSVITIPFNGINRALENIKGIDIAGIKPFDWISTINVPQIPLLAQGGIVDSPTLSIIGEAGTEAVVPLSKNAEWMKPLYELLDKQNENQREEKENTLVVTAAKLLTLDNFSLGSLSEGQTIIYYDFSGLTWSPQFGNVGNESDDFMEKVKAHEAEFMDWLEEFVRSKEEGVFCRV